MDLRDRDLRDRDLHDSGGQDREISLGTTTILGIFFALALLCAVFFGFGYSLGRHSAQPAAIAAEAAAEPDSSNGPKPSSGSPGSQSRSGSTQDQPTDASHADSSSEDRSAEPAGSSQQEAAPVRTVVATSGAETRAASAAKKQEAKAMAASALAPGSPVVQVAAVSHQEDATNLAAALKQRGYNVSVRQAPQDKLLHVQVGPFATKKEADAMRQRLQADGYNAIVK